MILINSTFSSHDGFPDVIELVSVGRERSGHIDGQFVDDFEAETDGVLASEFIVNLLLQGIQPRILIEEVQNVFVHNGAVSDGPNRTVSTHADVVEHKLGSFRRPRDVGRLIGPNPGIGRRQHGEHVRPKQSVTASPCAIGDPKHVVAAVERKQEGQHVSG